jgi:hypothetical protein
LSLSDAAPIRAAQDRPNEHFTIISNANARNAGPVPLSGLAMAMHTYLISIPPEWSITMDQVAQDVFKLDSRERVRRAARELMDAGFLVLHRERGETGRFKSWYQVFHSPQPVEGRTPSTARRKTGRRKTGVRSDLQESRFPQVAPAAGKPAAGKPAGNQKTVAEDSKKTVGVAGSPDGAADAAAARGAILCDVRTALTRAYGPADSGALDDGLCLDLWEYLKPKSGKVGRRVSYLMKVFDETPDIGTLISKAYAAAEHTETVTYPGDGSAEAFRDFYHLGPMPTDTLNRVEDLMSRGADHDRILSMISFAKATA